MKAPRNFILLVMALLIGSPAACIARLGENEAECAARYGKPNLDGTADKFGSKLNTYRSAGMLIYVSFINGRAECITFEKEPAADWPEEEIDLLLRANSQGKEWRRIDAWGDWPLRWSRSDQARARYRGKTPFHDLLVIETDAYVQFQTKKNNPALQKF